MVHAFDPIKNVSNWIIWKNLRRRGKDGEYKNVKLPIDPHTGIAASVQNPATWGTYHEAKAGYRRFGGDGLGIVFTKDLGITGIDLDHCYDENGKLSTFAEKIVSNLNSYTERSPSGDGLHILVFAKIPENLKKKNIEMYDNMRYFTVTGDRLLDCPDQIARRQMETSTLFKKHNSHIRKTPEMTSEDEIRDMLQAIPPSGLDYNQEWIRILMAIHSVYPSYTGLRLAQEWCQHTSYQGELEQKWKSFSRTAKNQVGIGTLVYLAKQYGWEPQNDPLDKVHPPLTAAQKEQINVIIDAIVEERVWEKYHANMTRSLRESLPIPNPVVDHFQIGYCGGEVNTETGEILNEGYTVPFFDLFGTVVNIEYRHPTGGFSYAVESPQLFYTVPMMGESDSPRHAILIPDSMQAITTYLQYSDMKIANHSVSYWGLPHMTLTQDSLSVLDDMNRIIVIADKYTDLRPYAALKDRARFLVLPLPVAEAVNYLSIQEIKRMLTQAMPYDAVKDL